MSSSGHMYKFLLGVFLGVESLGRTDLESGYDERTLHLIQQMWKWVQRPEVTCLVSQLLSGRDGIHATLKIS